MARKKPDEKLLTVAEVSQMTGLSDSTIYEGRCETHVLKRIKLRSTAKGRATIRFYLSDVTAWIEARVETAQSEQPKLKRITAADRVIDLIQFKKSRGL